MNNTLSPDEARLAVYYSRGAVIQEPAMIQAARSVADGGVSYSQALDGLVSDYLRNGGDMDRLDMAEERLGKRLGDLAERFGDGLADAPVAIVRPDIHPSVLVGLGIEPDGLLSKAEINALLSGHRADGEAIDGKHYARERSGGIDPRTGEIKTASAIGAYDFCPTPAKSVSVAWAFSSGAEQAMILRAHLDAARDAVGLIATQIGQARSGQGGRDGREPGHVGWLEFTHHTSRRTVQKVSGDGVVGYEKTSVAGDPDLHTHFLILNAVFTESGRVGSLDTAAVRGFIFSADAYYHARLAQNLRDAGFDAVRDERTQSARLVAVPESVERVFSKRTNAGEAKAKADAAARGEDWDSLSAEQQAVRLKNATQTKSQKARGDKDDVADVEDWRRQAVESGWTPPASFIAYGPPAPELAPEIRHRMAYEVAVGILDDKLQHKAVLTHHEVRTTAAIGLIEAGIQGGVADIDAVTRIMREEGVRQYGAVTPLIWGQEVDKRHVSITTGLHEADEREFLTLAKAAAGDRSAALSPRAIDAAARHSGLDFTSAHGKAQLSAIHRLGEGGRLGVGLGSAGAGKTAMLKVLNAAWQQDGREVWGTSLAWRQADDLIDAGIDRARVKAFSVMLDGIKDGSIALGPRSMLAVDEWGLLGTRQGLELLRLRDQQGFAIVALADDRQLASIEAGAIVDLSRRALGPEQIPVIATTVRQQTEWEKQIVGLIREGKPREALDMKRSDGSAELVPGGREALIARVASLYVERIKETGTAPAISAPTNAEAHAIGVAVREERRKLGLVGPDVMTVRATDGAGQDLDLRLAKGDRVRLFRSTGADYGGRRGGSIGRNGSVLTVQDVRPDGLVLESRTGKVGMVTWDKLTAKGSNRVQLAYGDVMTIHTAQGSTAPEHILALPGGSATITGEAGYVGATRHRLRSFIVTSEQAERRDIAQRRPLNDTRSIGPDDAWANVARHLLPGTQKDLATRFIETATALRRGSVRALHAALLPAEQRRRVGQSPSDVPERVIERRMQRLSLGHRVMEQVRHTVEHIHPALQHRRQAPSLRL